MVITILLGLVAVYVLYAGTARAEVITAETERPAELGGPGANTGTKYEDDEYVHVNQMRPTKSDIDRRRKEPDATELFNEISHHEYDPVKLEQWKLGIMKRRDQIHSSKDMPTMSVDLM